MTGPADIRVAVGDSKPSPRVVVVGGGLAGMAAAVALESAGCQVTLIEARKRLGGRAGSHRDPRTDEEIDNCQHVLLGCCTNLLDFYRRIGADSLIQFQPSINFMDEHGRVWPLKATPGLPAPLNLGWSFARLGALTLAERLAATRAMLAMMRTSPTERQRLSESPFGDWLDAHDQPASLIAKLYDPVLIGALNEDTRQANAAHAIHVFQDSLLRHRRGCAMGVSSVPLSRLYDRLPCRDVRLGERVQAMLFDGPTDVVGVKLANGDDIRADAVVLAAGYHAAMRWVPPQSAATDDRFAGLDKLQSVPILGSYLRFDRPILDVPHAALLRGPLQWVFRDPQDPRVLHGVISAARAWVDVPRDEALARFVGQLRDLLPRARDAKLEYGAVVIEKRATFAALPGVDRHRPAQAPPPGGIAGLYLAGDYTRTGWPATMEGAVRSGYSAAQAINGNRFLAPDLTPEWPAKWLEPH
jgi:zeta-carotene desaturase